jgi:protein-L-isoaspartate(D-aspartate) O-methyltransferase
MTHDGSDADRMASARRAMVRDQLAARGISDAAVLRVMESVPREQFVPASLAAAAYDDRALPVAENQTISQPYIVAYMTQALAIERRHRALEIGTGTGYQTAILALLGGEVYSIERSFALHQAARQRLEAMGLKNVRLMCGDGTLGWPEYAPFDRILVTAGAPEVPGPLVDQLTESGRMIIPVGPTARQTLVRVEKRQGRTIESPLLPCRFVRLVGQAGWEGDGP